MAKKPFYTAEQVRQIQGLLAAQGGAAGVGAAATGAAKGGLGKLLGGVSAKGVGRLGGGFLAWWLLDKLLSAGEQAQMRGVQREAIQAQAAARTPESLYYQAALPGAQEEERVARQALMAQLSGGVLGPSLARGERLIG